MEARRRRRERSENFAPRRISSLFRAGAIPGLPVHEVGSGDAVKLVERESEGNLFLFLPFLLSLSLAQLANRERRIQKKSDVTSRLTRISGRLIPRLLIFSDFIQIKKRVPPTRTTNSDGTFLL